MNFCKDCLVFQKCGICTFDNTIACDYFVKISLIG